MMTRPKAKQPLDSFDPRMMQLLMHGARRRIVIPFPGERGKALAHTFQRRLHTLRARMRQDNHEHSRLVSRCYVRLLWGKKAVDEHLILSEDWIVDDKGKLGAFIVVQPMDLVFDPILSQLDLPGPGPSTPQLTELPPLPEPAVDELENWLKTLKPKD